MPGSRAAGFIWEDTDDGKNGTHGCGVGRIAGGRERAHGLGTDRQDRPDQQLFRLSRPGRRPDGQKGIDLYVKEHEKDLPPGVKIEIIRATTPPIRRSASAWRRS